MKSIVGSICLSVVAGCFAVPAGAGEAQLRADVGFLAGERLEGRMTGSEGEALAVEYIAAQLKQLGAVPLPGLDGYSQPFDFTAGMHDGGSTVEIVVAGETHAWSGDDVQALSFSDDATVSGEIVFAGYGLSVPEEQGFGYDSYFGLDVKDKIVVALRYVPEDVDDETRAILAHYSGLRYKALHARERGAKALVLVTGPRSPNAGETIPMMFDTALGGSGIAAASVSAKVADVLFRELPEGGLEKVQQDLDTGNPHVQGFALTELTMTLSTKVLREKQTGHNVVGWLKPDGAASDDWVLIGAHFDHLGRGDRGNSLAGKEDKGQIHFGADDNASGVAAVLEMARRLAKTARPVNVALAFWSGEELGLLGSTHFIESALLAPESIRAYINFDMVGRMRDEQLNLQSVGSSPDWARLIEQANVAVGLDLKLQNDPYLPTDSTAFYQARIPAIHFFTGSHEDYHKPTDTVDMLNYEGLDEVVAFATLLTRKISQRGAALEYAEVERTRESGTDRDTVRAYTGTIPDYTEEIEGLLLSGVVGGGPADQAGLQKGDVIVKFGEREIANIYDYTFALDVARIGETLEIVYVRDGKRQTTTLTPTSRK
jgi:acetylornithine deacetylase/succinyl-diaminopimelate desuccinylase-like protein